MININIASDSICDAYKSARTLQFWTAEVLSNREHRSTQGFAAYRILHSGTLYTLMNSLLCAEYLGNLSQALPIKYEYLVDAHWMYDNSNCDNECT